MMIWERGWNALRTAFGFRRKGTWISLSTRFGETWYRKVPKHSEINWPKFIAFGKELVGKPYRLGAEVNIHDILKSQNPADIKEIDCSELVEVLFRLVGVPVPDGSYNQFKVSRPVIGDLLIGDLGFKWNPENQVVHHVGVWIDGAVLEAKGKAFGVILTPRESYERSSHFAGWRRLNAIADA